MEIRTATKRAILLTEKGKTQDVTDAIFAYAKANDIKDVIVNRIADNMLTLHAPEAHFEELKKLDGIKQAENSRPLRSPTLSL